MNKVTIRKLARISMFLLLMVFLLNTSKAEASAAVYSGTCGEHAVWSFNKDNGCLTISGTGEVSTAPWSSTLSIKKVIVEPGITALSDRLFDQEKELTEAILSDTITYMGAYMFEGCPKLSYVKLPDQLVTIGQYCFKECEALTKLKIPASLKSYKNGLYSSAIKEIEIAEGTTEIVNNMFYGMSSLENIVLPRTLKKIGNSAFEQCVRLKEVTIPSSVTVIGSKCFGHCTALEKIRIPKTVEYVGKNCFEYSGLTEATFEEGAKSVPAAMFKYVEKLKNVHLAGSIRWIGDDAFFSCKELTDVTLPKQLETIGGSAFYLCEKLESLVIPKRVSLYGSLCFGQTGITKLEYESGMVTLPDGATGSAPKLQVICIPDTVKLVRSGAIRYNPNLTSITFPESVTNIEGCSFRDCDSLQSIIIRNPNVNMGEFDYWDPENIKIYGVEGSTAEAYAKRHEKPFVAKWKQMNRCVSSLAMTVEETGKEIMPLPVVKDGAKALAKGKDYTVSYRNNRALGTATVIITGTEAKYIGSITKTFKIIPAKNRIYSIDGLKYRISNARTDGKGTVSVAGAVKSSTSITIPKTVRIGGYTYKVTAIEKKAFYKQSKITKVKIKSATITSIGQKAFFKIGSKAKIKVPAQSYKAYSKMLKNSGLKKGVSIYK